MTKRMDKSANAMTHGNHAIVTAIHTCSVKLKSVCHIRGSVSGLTLAFD